MTNTTGLVFISLVLLFPFAVPELSSMQAMPNVTALLAIVYYGVFATVLAYLLWTHGVGRVSGEAAGIASAAMPASSVLLGALILGEPVTHHHVLGCGLVMAGIACSTLFTRPESCDMGT